MKFRTLEIAAYFPSTATAAPYCATFNYPGGSVGFGCYTSQGYTVSVLLSTTTNDGGPLSTFAPTNTPTTASSASTASTTSTIAATSSSRNGLGGGPIAGIVIGSVAVVALLACLAFWILRTRRKDREEKQTLQQRNSFPQQAQSNYNGQWPHETTAGYYGGFKHNSMPGSPPSGGSVGSPHTDSFGQSPRHSHPPDYIGPTMPELGLGNDHR